MLHESVSDILKQVYRAGDEQKNMQRPADEPWEISGFSEGLKCLKRDQAGITILRNSPPKGGRHLGKARGSEERFHIRGIAYDAFCLPEAGIRKRFAHGLARGKAGKRCEFARCRQHEIQTTVFIQI